jgi:hypothetical protein
MQTSSRRTVSTRTRAALLVAVALTGLMLIGACGDGSGGVPANGINPVGPGINPIEGLAGPGGPGGGPGITTARSPEDTVRAYFQAAETNDCEALISLTTRRVWSSDGKNTREEALAECNEGGDAEFERAQVGSMTTIPGADGNTSVVTASVTVEDETRDVEFELVKEDGGWKVDDLKVK